MPFWSVFIGFFNQPLKVNSLFFYFGVIVYFWKTEFPDRIFHFFGVSLSISGAEPLFPRP